MSKKSIKEKKTLEELLEVALVPEEEQPYEVPENWVWTYLGIFCRLFNGYAYKSTDYSEIGLPLIRISDINEGDVNITDKTVRVPQKFLNDKFTIRKGDLLIAMSGSIGKVGIYNADEPALQNQRVGNIKTLFPEVLLDGYRNLFVAHSARTIQKLSYGGVVQNVSGELIEGLKLPLPPLPEQKRIVDRVESFLEKINEAKRLIEEAKETFASRRAAILAKAFRGELTKELAESNSTENTVALLEKINNLDNSVEKNAFPYDLPKGWVWTTFDKVADIKSNLVSPFDFPSMPHIAPDNIEKHTGRLLDYSTVSEDGVTSPKHYFYAGQILYSKIRPYLSKAIIASFDGLCSADMYPIESKIETEYLYYYILSETFLQFVSSSGSRTVLPKINQTELAKIPVPVAPLEEQKKIVQTINCLLQKEREAIDLIGVETLLENLQQSILSKVFMGQLGTNIPEEESAIELIKETLSKQLS